MLAQNTNILEFEIHGVGLDIEYIAQGWIRINRAVRTGRSLWSAKVRERWVGQRVRIVDGDAGRRPARRTTGSKVGFKDQGFFFRLGLKGFRKGAGATHEMDQHGIYRICSKVLMITTTGAGTNGHLLLKKG